MGFTDIGLYRISESVRAYVYLILSSQASARSGIVGNTASALTAQSAFLNNFENIVNCRVDIREDIKRYQDTLSYASSKVDYNVRENIYMLPSEMNLKIKTGTVGYNNKILISDGNFSLEKNDEVNAGSANSLALEEPIIPMQKGHPSHGVAQQPLALRTYKAIAQQTHDHELAKKPTHEDEKIALVFFLAGGFTIWNIFDETIKHKIGNCSLHFCAELIITQNSDAC